MQTIKIAIIDDSEETRTTLKEYLCKEEIFHFCGEAADGNTGLQLIADTQPDVIILDLIMPILDGFGVLEQLRQKLRRPKVLVLSALAQDSCVARAMQLGAEYYMLKPYDILTLKQRVISLVVPEKQSVAEFSEMSRGVIKHGYVKSVDEKLTNIFLSVGIPAHIKGFQFLREAIKMTIDSPTIINYITTKLYPGVAVKFETSSTKVERAIRHAIEVAWNRGKIENINNIFGIRVYSTHDKPTNGEFIALVADKMLLEGA